MSSFKNLITLDKLKAILMRSDENEICQLYRGILSYDNADLMMLYSNIKGEFSIDDKFKRNVKCSNLTKVKTGIIGTVLYFIFSFQIKNNIKPLITKEIISKDFEFIDEILSNSDMENEYYVVLLEYFMKIWAKFDDELHLSKISSKIDYFLDNDIDLSFIRDPVLVKLLGYVRDKYISKLINNIKNINVINEISVFGLNKTLSCNNVLDVLLNKGVKLDNLYIHNLNLVSLFVISKNKEMLKKTMNLTSLSPEKIDTRIIHELRGGYLNLEEELELISSLENFDDFININFFVLMKISDEKTMRYIMRF